ncbi:MULTISPECIES: rhombosortase [Microbulbifer]|uniref:rhombosortase n=1 Tax=Microbulbifer TaxID=48073 RepID=UPI001E46BB85|nr:MULTISPECIES: rhombosortase [Microbulbifer]UHQ54918.1 rhombosortase [Microbulbifer sp. YPW16]
MQKVLEKLSLWTGPAILVGLALVVHFSPQDLDMLLRYDRGLVLSGEYWRIASGHFAHTNLNHLLLNLAALLLYWVLFPNRLPLPRLLVEVAVLATLCGLALVLFEPQVHWYMGLSGLIHGLLALSATLEILERETRWRGGLLLTILALKVYSEQYGTGGSLVSQWIGAPVVHEAHLWGLLCGVVAALCIALGALLGETLARGTGALRR